MTETSTASRLFGSGPISKIVGSLLVILGFLISLTGGGAILGVPMIVVGVIFFFAGGLAWICLAGVGLFVAMRLYG